MTGQGELAVVSVYGGSAKGHGRARANLCSRRMAGSLAGHFDSGQTLNSSSHKGKWVCHAFAAPLTPVMPPASGGRESMPPRPHFPLCGELFSSTSALFAEAASVGVERKLSGKAECQASGAQAEPEDFFHTPGRGGVGKKSKPLLS